MLTGWLKGPQARKQEASSACRGARPSNDPASQPTRPAHRTNSFPKAGHGICIPKVVVIPAPVVFMLIKPED